VVSPEVKPELFAVDLYHKCQIFCQKNTKKVPKYGSMLSVVLLCSWLYMTVTCSECRVTYHYSLIVCAMKCKYRGRICSWLTMDLPNDKTSVG